jgi:hypothetical protein
MPYGYINQLPPPPPPKGEAGQKEFAKKAGCIAAGIGFIASLVNTGYIIDGLINGAIWFGIVYGITRLIQRNKNGQQ